MAQGEPAVAALEARPPQGRQGLGHELSVFLLVPFMLLTWDFWKLSLSSPGTDKSSALSLLSGTQWVWGLIEEVSDHLP